MRDRKIGLALSSGGLFGFAHIGVIQALEDRGIRPNLVAGTSAGAIVGLVYADGGIKGLETFVRLLKETGLISKRGIFSSVTPERYFTRIGGLLRTLIHEKDLQALAIPFYPVATNIGTGRAHIFEHGDPIDTTLASATYPGAFKPRRVGGDFFVDGGLTEYLPVRVIDEKGADATIGSVIDVLEDLSAAKSRDINRAELLIRSIQVLQAQLSSKQIEECDYVVRPKFSTSDWYKVDELDRIIKVGYEETEKLFRRNKTLL